MERFLGMSGGWPHLTVSVQFGQESPVSVGMLYTPKSLHSTSYSVSDGSNWSFSMNLSPSHLYVIFCPKSMCQLSTVEPCGSSKTRLYSGGGGLWAPGSL